jgi:hypothetical protein
MKKEFKEPKVDERYIACGDIGKSVDGKHYVGFFRGKPMWLLLKNDAYDEIMKGDFPNKYYKHPLMVPKFNIMKNRKKVGHLFPRKAKDGNKDKFLFATVNGRKYYIWKINKNYSPYVKSKIYFDIKNDWESY